MNRALVTRIAVTLLALLPLGATAEAVTGLWYHRTATASRAAETRLLQPPTDLFELKVQGPGALELHINGISAGSARLSLAPPPMMEFAVGAHEGTGSVQFSLGVPSNGPQCNAPGKYVVQTGRFVVKEVAFDSGYNVASLAVNFEQRCDDGAVSYGELRLNSAVPFTFSELPGSTLPDAFAFNARIARPSTWAESNATTIYGINAPAMISVEGGEYSLNGQPYTTTPAQVLHRDRVQVRVMSASDPGVTRSATLRVGAASARFEVTTHAATFSAIHLRKKSVTTGSSETLLEVYSPQGTFSGSGSPTGVSMTTPGGPFLMEGPISAGVYEETVGQPAGALQILSFDQCQGPGRVVVLEAAYGPGEVLVRFAANFEQTCGTNPSPIYGELRFNSSYRLTDGDSTPDAEPDPFLLQAQDPVRAGALVTSNTISVVGIGGPVPISVVGGNYSINGGPFTSSPGTAIEFDQVEVRVAASRTAGGTAQATLTIGSRSATFSVATWQPATPLTGFYYRSIAGEYMGRGLTRLYLAPRNRIDQRAGISPSGQNFTIANVDRALMFISMQSRDLTPLAVGTYPLVPGNGGPYAGIAINSNGGCTGTEFGSFTIHEIVRRSDGTLERFAANFEQRCLRATDPPLFAEIRINSTVPFSALAGGTCAPGDTDGDGASDCVEVDEGHNPAIRDNDIFTDATAFARQQYRDFLVREGDADGITYWAGQVSSGALSRGAVIEQFLNSPEFGGVLAPVARLYFAYFLRIPDKAGIDYWVDYHLAGNSMEAVSNQFARSAEFANTYGALDNAAFVNLIYRNVLGREPDADGLAFWKQQLDSGQRDRGQVMLAFSESPEYVSLASNDVFVTMAYMGMLQRTPDAGGYAYWVNYMDSGNSGLALINAFLGASEYRNRFLP